MPTNTLPGRTRPRDGELLSSWIVRLALQNGLKLHTFCQLLWRDNAVWTRDIDNLAPAQLLEALATATFQQAKDLTKLTLRSYAGVVFETHNPIGFTPWILPLGIYHRTRQRHGLQFCSDCLDEQPRFYRKAWRLAVSVICERHMVLLNDRCICGSPVNFQRIDIETKISKAGARNITRCSGCGGDLRNARSLSPDLTTLAAALEMQRLCFAAIDSGYASIPGLPPIRSVLFFAGLRQLLRLLVRTRNISDLRGSIEIWRAAHGISFEVNALNTERASSSERLTLLALVGDWIFNWPHHFTNSCLKAKLTASDIYRDMTYVPFWLAEAVEPTLNLSTYCPTLPEIANAIRYLRKRDLVVNRSSVSRLLGSSDAFRKRKLHYMLEMDFDIDSLP